MLALFHLLTSLLTLGLTCDKMLGCTCSKVEQWGEGVKQYGEGLLTQKVFTPVEVSHVIVSSTGMLLRVRMVRINLRVCWALAITTRSTWGGNAFISILDSTSITALSIHVWCQWWIEIWNSSAELVLNSTIRRCGESISQWLVIGVDVKGASFYKMFDCKLDS